MRKPKLLRVWQVLIESILRDCDALVPDRDARVHLWLDLSHVFFNELAQVVLPIAIQIEQRDTDVCSVWSSLHN